MQCDPTLERYRRASHLTPPPPLLLHLPLLVSCTFMTFLLLGRSAAAAVAPTDCVETVESLGPFQIAGSSASCLPLPLPYPPTLLAHAPIRQRNDVFLPVPALAQAASCTTAFVCICRTKKCVISIFLFKFSSTSSLQQHQCIHLRPTPTLPTSYSFQPEIPQRALTSSSGSKWPE